MTAVRLQKFLSEAGICSRRKGEAYILAGRIRVNGRIVDTLGAKVDPLKDTIEFDGRRVERKRKLLYIALHKPKGYVSSCHQPGDKIVLDLVNVGQRVYPVGRLDRDSTGLLLLTNDGRLHHRLSHPSFDHEKEYDVQVAHPLTAGALRKMAQGMPLMGTHTRPAKVIRKTATRFRIVLQEGRNRQIRRMVRKLGNRVKALHRIRIANVKLGQLAPGTWRYLSEAERRQLFARLSHPPGRPARPRSRPDGPYR